MIYVLLFFDDSYWLGCFTWYAVLRRVMPYICHLMVNVRHIELVDSPWGLTQTQRTSRAHCSSQTSPPSLRSGQLQLCIPRVTPLYGVLRRVMSLHAVWCCYIHTILLYSIPRRCHAVPVGTIPLHSTGFRAVLRFVFLHCHLDAIWVNALYLSLKII